MPTARRDAITMGQNATQTSIKVGRLKDLFDQEATQIVSETAPKDQMYRTDPSRNFRWGHEALRCIKLAVLAAGKDDLKNIFDLPCGHGWVLRTLKAAFPEAGITACDLNRDGVDFCARAFGATPVYARKLPEQIQIESSFDLIWCGSLLTHLDFERWPGFLRLSQSLLVQDGISREVTSR